MKFPIINEMRVLERLEFPPSYEGSLEVSLIIPVRKATDSLRATVRESDKFLRTQFAESFEIILVPNPSPTDPTDHSIPISQALAKEFSTVRVCPHLAPPGKGAAIRAGF